MKDTPRAILKEMQDDLVALHLSLEQFEGNAVNVAALDCAIVRAMNELDVAVQRAGRV